MKISRRNFLSIAGTIAGSSIAGKPSNVHARESKAPLDPFGCLLDISRCVGCRKCEMVCNQFHGLAAPKESFDDLRVFDERRRPTTNLYTVVNRYHTGKLDDRNALVPTYVKVNCMHCQDPGCVSACIVGAMTKKENGAVHYDAGKCIGCRYCMVACPFQIPAYEYEKPFTPKVQKCTLCYDRIIKEGEKTACSAICPVEAITFGKRADLLKMAKTKIEKFPDRYINKIYGEREVGGTSWLYISSDRFEDIGFLDLPDKSIPRLTETIQHSLFNYLWSPMALFALLGGIMFMFNRSQFSGNHNDNEKGDDK